MPLEKSAGAVIFHKKGKEIYYLLLHYKSGHWDFPKGHIEKGEKEVDTVRREVKEETGLANIKIIPGFKEYVKYFFRAYKGKEKSKTQKRETIFKIVDFYLAESLTEKVKISWEHIGFNWLTYEEALKQLTYKNAKEILKKAHQFLVK